MPMARHTDPRLNTAPTFTNEWWRLVRVLRNSASGQIKNIPGTVFGPISQRFIRNSYFRILPSRHGAGEP